MDRKLIAEILAAHADRLLQGQKAKAREILVLFSNGQEIKPLLQVAEEVKETIRPVKPAPGFREELEKQLLAEAQTTLFQKKPPPSIAKSGLLIILAAIGSVILSLIGVVAYLIRGRKHPRPQSSH